MDKTKNVETELYEQLCEFEAEVVGLCLDCKRTLEDKDFLNFSRIIQRVGSVVQKVAPVVETAARIAQKHM